MNLNEYQEAARTTAVYPVNFALEYTALGLCGEVGEYANKVKKFIRGDWVDVMPSQVKIVNEQMAEELGDVLWYLAMCAHVNGYTLEEVAQMNLQKLAERREKNTIKGSGDKR